MARRVVTSAWCVIFLELIGGGIAGLEQSKPALAGPPAAAPSSQMFPWISKDYYECGMDCLYQRSIENLSLQAIYELNLIQRLEKEADRVASEASGKRRDQANHQLAGMINGAFRNFCAAVGVSSDGRKCALEFKRLQTRRLQQLRKALISNADARARLEDKEGGTVYAIDRAVQGEPLKSQITYLPTYEELQRQYEKDAEKLEDLASERYAKWVRSVVRAPSKEDFVLFREVPRDPSKPSEKIIVAVTDCSQIKASAQVQCKCEGSQGSVFCFNQAGYQDASKQFATTEKEKSFDKRQEDMLKADPTRQKNWKKIKSWKQVKQQMKFSKDTYEDARISVAIEANENLKSNGIVLPKEYNYGTKLKAARKKFIKNEKEASKIPSGGHSPDRRLAVVEEDVKQIQENYSSDEAVVYEEVGSDGKAKSIESIKRGVQVYQPGKSSKNTSHSVYFGPQQMDEAISSIDLDQAGSGVRKPGADQSQPKKAADPRYQKTLDFNP